MRFFRFLVPSLLAFSLLLTGARVYAVAAVTAAKKEHSAHSNKPARFHYVCPMHEDVISKPLVSVRSAK
jgi:hypothetical protein